MNSSNIGNDHVVWIRNSQRLLNNLHVGYTLSDMNNEILEVNESMVEISGYGRKELIGRRLNDLFLESDLEKLRLFDKRVDEFENIDTYFQYEFFARRPNGDIIPTLVNISVNFDKKGKPLTFNNLVSDISELKNVQSALENRTKLLETVLFGIGDCVTVFSEKGRILIENPKGRTIRGNRKSPLLDLSHGNEKSFNLKTGKEIRSYDARIEAVHDEKGETFAYVETLTDTTDRKKLEKQTEELNRIRRSIRHREIESKIIGKSKAMTKVFDLILRCAEVDSNILILGETGVGKEMAAMSIHNLSRRKDKPFVAVNCGALPDSLLESELFGHVKGAFTGAIADRPGLFREASGGTLFLDEIGDISSQMQVKLLRALQEKEIRPLGDNRKYRVDVRVITATNKDLNQLIHQGLFRTDLYYRIAVIPLTIPPLKDRGDDILLLARHFLKKYKKKANGQFKTISHKGQALLMRYSWPGNIRELENAIEYALAMSKSDTIRSTDFPFNIMSEQKGDGGQEKPLTKPNEVNVIEVSNEKPASEVSETVAHGSDSQEEETKAILSALNSNFGKRDLAAESLGIHRVSLWRKMKKLGLSDWKFKKNAAK